MPVTLHYPELLPAWNWVKHCATDITFTNLSGETVTPIAGLMDAWQPPGLWLISISDGNGVPGLISHRRCVFMCNCSFILLMQLKVLKPVISISQSVLQSARQSINQSISWLAHWPIAKIFVYKHYFCYLNVQHVKQRNSLFHQPIVFWLAYWGQ